MITFDDVSLRYHYDEFTLLKNLSFTLDKGVNTILCDTQSGKTSLCKLLTKEVSPTGGQIFLDGNDICGITNQGLGILYLPSFPAFFENRSARFNLEYPLRVRKVGKSERVDRANAVAELLRLDSLDVKAKKLDALSCKKLALARGLTVPRQTVLFDDFFEDKAETEEILRVISLFGNITAVILTSYARLAIGNTVVLDGGTVVFQGDAETAKGIVSNLGWLTESLRSYNG